MSFKDRLDGRAYTCSNDRFETDVRRGRRHGPRQARGAVFPQALLRNTRGYSLWLEHVIEKKTRKRVFWLMWYDRQGSPTIPLSGILGAQDIREIVKRLADLIQIT